MDFFNANTTRLAQENNYYRAVLFTDEKSQLVLMSIPPHENIPEEVHAADQIILIVEGSGQAILNGTQSPFEAGHTIIIPLGTKHIIQNTYSTPLKLITIYTPPQHKPGTVHKTRADETEAY